MKIEMGESLLYSWLRHVKKCQIVEINWKTSNKWKLQNEKEIAKLFEEVDNHFCKKNKYKIFKQNSSLSQVITQTECDLLGISTAENQKRIYAIEVAFHSAGLNYGTKEETIMKVISKGIRMAMCIYGYMNSKEAEIIFVSPKINEVILKELESCINDINKIFGKLDMNFKMKLIANNKFNDCVLQEILDISESIVNTNELFIRSYQMLDMFNDINKTQHSLLSRKLSEPKVKQNKIKYHNISSYSEFAVGKIANVVLRKMLEEGLATDEEIELLQTDTYSKKIFNVQYPVLIKTNSIKREERYFKELLHIRGETYRLCSEWFENKNNNDRSYLLKWIEAHSR